LQGPEISGISENEPRLENFKKQFEMVTNSFNSMIDRISAQQETTGKKTKTYSAF
jgi:hypothetical protein